MKTFDEALAVRKQYPLRVTRSKKIVDSLKSVWMDFEMMINSRAIIKFLHDEGIDLVGIADARNLICADPPRRVTSRSARRPLSQGFFAGRGNLFLEVTSEKMPYVGRNNASGGGCIPVY